MTEIDLLLKALNQQLIDVEKKSKCDRNDLESAARLVNESLISSNKFVEHLTLKLFTTLNSKSCEPLLAYDDLMVDEATNELRIIRFKLFTVSLLAHVKSKRSNVQVEQILDVMRHVNRLLSSLIKSHQTFATNDTFTEDGIVKFISLLTSTFKFDYFRKLNPFREDSRVCLLVITFFNDLDSFVDNFAQLKLNDLVTRSTMNVYMMSKYLRLIDRYLNFSRSLISNETSFKIKTLMNLIRSGLFDKIRIDDILNRKLESNEPFNASNLAIEFHVQSIILLIKLMINVQNKTMFDEIQLSETESLRASLEKILLDTGSIKYIASKFDMIFLSQDDYLIDFNLNCLLIEIHIDETQQSMDTFPNSLFKFHLNSNILVIKLLISISFDYQILIDWLITNETNFLLYFVKYLKCLHNQLIRHDLSFGKLIEHLESHNKSLLDNFSLFLLNYNNLNTRSIDRTEKSLLQCKENQPKKQLDEFEIYFWRLVETLRELNQKIKLLKSSFPYNCQPLIRLLDKLLQSINPVF